MEPRRSPRVSAPATLAAGVAAAALAPAGVVLLRLFPPLMPGEHDVGWLLPAAGGAASLVLGAALLLSLQHAQRRGSGAAWLRAAALGILAAGVAVGSMRAVDAAAGPFFPDGGLAPAALAAGAILLIAQLAGGSLRPGRSGPPLEWVLLFAVIEAGVAAAVLLPRAGGLWPWLLGTAAALAAASAVPGPMVAAALTAGGMTALAASRVGTVEPVIGLVALAAGGVAYAWRPARDVATPRALAPGEPVREPTQAGNLPTASAVDEEAMRLARELRGTIDELMHARRTIEQQRQEIARGATVDELTGMATRGAILERLRIEAAGARRYPHPLALVLLDIDGFAALNAEHGLGVGDEVLREVALRLRLRMRGADALGRVGGDSFLALLPHTDETGAAMFANALRSLLLSRPVETAAGEVVLRVSIGVAFMRPGMDLGEEDLLAAADEALASARAAGGNRIAFDRLHGLVRLEERRPKDAGA